MLFLDVNVCIHALYFDATDEARGVSRWLHDSFADAEPVALSPVVLASMIRIGTNRRLYPRALPPDQVVAVAEALRAAPRAVVVEPGPRHWRIFTDLIREHDLTGNDVQDAYLAALALEHGATFVTRDRGFRRFARLRVLDPLAPPAT